MEPSQIAVIWMMSEERRQCEIGAKPSPRVASPFIRPTVAPSGSVASPIARPARAGDRPPSLTNEPANQGGRMYVDGYLLNEQSAHFRRGAVLTPRRTLASFGCDDTPTSGGPVGLARRAGDIRIPPCTAALSDQLVDREEEPMVIDSGSPETIHETVREHYAAAAVRASRGDCCAPGDEPIGSELYSALDGASCRTRPSWLRSAAATRPRSPTSTRASASSTSGSGGGIDVLLSARRVGPTGRAFGLDMTDEMLALAQRNAAEAKATNVEFLKGHIEAIPLPADSIDVVISNCVVNLAADKPSVFREIARVLRPGGRIGISDIVAEDRLSPAERFERGSYVGCIAGALCISEFREGLEAVGMTDISITPTHDVADGMLSAIIAATKPADAAPLASSPAARSLPVVSEACC